MHYEINPKDLLTPPIHFGGINQNNPVLTSSDLFSLDDNDVCFSSILPENNEHDLVTKDNIKEDSENYQQQEDLFSSLDLPVLSELENADLQIDGLQFDKYMRGLSLPSHSTDIVNSSISEDLTFYSMDDATSSALPWVAEECTVEINNYDVEDMMVPASPTLSSTSSSPSISKKRATRKSSLSTMERKLRKKDQNKTAAEKYRTKKRTEREELSTRHGNLKNQNRELRFEMENLTFQLEQFKQLFVDVLQIPIPSGKSN